MASLQGHLSGAEGILRLLTRMIQWLLTFATNLGYREASGLARANQPFECVQTD